MKLYHVRSGTGEPNYEAICVESMYQGWNPGRDSGLFGTGLYSPVQKSTLLKVITYAGSFPMRSQAQAVLYYIYVVHM